eukprot:TRINITY_DN1836_c0_g3_i1.p1 TRINITY_DN1836_c0_g3~~TRINITY_DN1836_c0_g3_i1.p1  ORF type:complete len:501 (+),score=108.40 TRINITY_DN1836_c0_g3_i1:182-1504(+)
MELTPPLIAPSLFVTPHTPPSPAITTSLYHLPVHNINNNDRDHSATLDTHTQSDENAFKHTYTPDTTRRISVLGIQVELGWRLVLRMVFVVLFVALMVGGFVVCTVLGYVPIFLEAVGKLGIWGMVIIGFAFSLMAFPFLFGYILLGIGTGLLYGWWGMFPIVIGSMAGAFVSFFVLKKFFRGWTERQIAKSAKFKAVFDSVGDNGIKIAFLIRYLPIPFGVQNALLSVSSIPFWKFMLGTFLGQFPEQLAIVWIGTTLHTFNDLVNGEVSSKNKVLLVVDVVMIILLLGILIYIGRRALKNVQANPEDQAGLLDAEMGGLVSNQSHDQADDEHDTFVMQEQHRHSPSLLLPVSGGGIPSNNGSGSNSNLTTSWDGIGSDEEKGMRRRNSAPNISELHSGVDHHHTHNHHHNNNHHRGNSTSSNNSVSSSAVATDDVLLS